MNEIYLTKKEGDSKNSRMSEETTAKLRMALRNLRDETDKQFDTLVKEHLTVHQLIGGENATFEKLPNFIKFLEEQRQQEKHKTDKNILNSKIELAN